MSDAELLYAPAFRLSTPTSELCVTWIFGVGLLLIAAACALQAWRAWARALQLRAEVWRTKGLRSGVVLVCGVAEPTDEERDAAAREAAAFAPFVELTIHQLCASQSGPHGKYMPWRESSRSLTERPFVLRTDDGTRFRVEPSGEIELIDRLEEPVRTGQGMRCRSARIVSGERIWVRGELVVGAAQGPYRGRADPPTLRPPRDRPLLVCSQPIEAEERSLLRMHAAFAAGFLLALILCQGVVFSRFRALSRGVEQTATLVSKRSWSTHHKNTTTKHFGYTLAPMGVEDEVSYDAYARGKPGDTVPIVRAADDPTVLEVGRRAELGLNGASPIAAGLLTTLLLIAWLVVTASRKPWWRRPRYDDIERL